MVLTFLDHYLGKTVFSCCVMGMILSKIGFLKTQTFFINLLGFLTLSHPIQYLSFGVQYVDIPWLILPEVLILSNLALINQLEGLLEITSPK